MLKLEGSHRQVLVDLIRKQIGNPRLGVEVGVHRGKTAQWLLLNFRQLRLVMVDRWDSPAVYKEAAHITRLNAFRTCMMRADSCSPPALGCVQDGESDFVFIDAGHGYEQVKRDLAAWWPKVRAGGLFCGHDYGKAELPGVKQAVDEWAAEIGYDINHELQGYIWWTKKSAN